MLPFRSSRRGRTAYFCYTAFGTNSLLMAGLLSLMAAMLPAQAANPAARLALVIGNSGYAHLPTAPTAIRDAHLITLALKDRGFNVTEKFNLERKSMLLAIKQFAAKIKQAGKRPVALIYYTGHGLEIAGKTLMVPADARLIRGTAVDYEIIGTHVLLRALAKAGAGLSLIFQDFPRNNPRHLTLRRPARLIMGPHMMLAYATSSGSPIRHTGNQYGSYAAALSEAIHTDGLKMPRFIRFIRSRVLSATGGRQITSEITGAGIVRSSSSVASRSAPIRFRFDGGR